MIADEGLDLMQSICRDMARRTQLKKDCVIKQVISAHLGRNNWVLEELKGRCVLKVPAAVPFDKRTETFCVDDVELVTFYPERFSTSKESLSTYMHAAFKYQLHIPCVIDMSEVE